MDQPTEQIGDLIYAPNPDYPYPFPVERPPHFWMTEQTGRLAEAIDAYFNGESLAPAAIDLIKQYLRQYVERAVMAEGNRRAALLGLIASLRTRRAIEDFVDELAELGIEPF